MQVRLFKFPVNQTNVDEIQVVSTELIYQNHVRKLEPEEQDWLDWANNVLAKVEFQCTYI